MPKKKPPTAKKIPWDQRRGRPTLPPDKRRGGSGLTVPIRLTVAEREEWEALATAIGQPLSGTARLAMKRLAAAVEAGEFSVGVT